MYCSNLHLSWPLPAICQLHTQGTDVQTASYLRSVAACCGCSDVVAELDEAASAVAVFKAAAMLRHLPLCRADKAALRLPWRPNAEQSPCPNRYVRSKLVAMALLLLGVVFSSVKDVHHSSDMRCNSTRDAC